MGNSASHVRHVRCEAAAPAVEENPATTPLVNDGEEPEPEYMKTQQYQIAGPDLYHGVYEKIIPPPVPEQVPPQNAQPKAMLTAPWIRDLAYHHGNYVPERYSVPKQFEEIKADVEAFEAKVHKDQPDDACKYLVIEEYRCLQTKRAEMYPEKASTGCVKWYDEWQKCKWDQEKFNAGYTHIEGPQMMKKRRPYIGYPDFKTL